MKVLFFCFLFSAVSSELAKRKKRESSNVIYPSIPAGVWVILPPLQLRAHHIGQAPGPAGATPHLPKLQAVAQEASGRVFLCEATADAVQACQLEFLE